MFCENNAFSNFFPDGFRFIFCSPSSASVMTFLGATLFLLRMEGILLSKASFSLLNLMHSRRQCKGVSFILQSPNS